MTVKELVKEFKEAEDGKEAFKIGFKYSQDSLKNKPWIPIVTKGALGCVIFIIGYKKGQKAGRIEYICDPDIEGIAKHGFETAAHLLDVFDEIESLSKNKVTKF